MSVGLHILSQFGWGIQTNHGYEMGTSSLRNVDT